MHASSDNEPPPASGAAVRPESLVTLSLPPQDNPTAQSVDQNAAGKPLGPSAPFSPAASSPPRSRRRNGKVARLPHRVRELVNLMLRDGLPYADISRKLAEHGHTLSTDSLSRWHSGGYQTWLREQDLLDDQHARLHFATRVLTEKDGQTIQEASIRIAILRMYSLLLDFNPAVLKDRIAQDPAAYTRILNALTKLSSGAIDLERARLERTDS